jgi:sigma-B regulation protein RsbU (phosphoserine phosphatase)
MVTSGDSSAGPATELRQARAEIERLRTLVDAARVINSSIEGHDLYQSILSVVRTVLRVERGTLFLLDRGAGELRARIAAKDGAQEIAVPVGTGIAGTVAQTGESIIVPDAYADPRFDPTADRASGFRTRSLLCAPVRTRQGVIVGVLQLLNKKKGSFGPEDLRFLESLADHMAIAISNAEYHAASIRKSKLEKELELAREIQAMLLPPWPSRAGSLDLAVRWKACYEVGGDYFDLLDLPGGDLGLVVGDVSGKGVAAALIMASVQAAIRTLAGAGLDLPAIAASVQDYVWQVARGKKFLTIFLGRFSPATGELRYVNAGHNPPLLVREGSLVPLPASGLPLGLFPQGRAEVRTVELPPGAMLALYTDGVTEAVNASDEEFGMPRLEEILRGWRGEDPDTVARTVLEAVAEFEGETPRSDDRTFIAARRPLDA